MVILWTGSKSIIFVKDVFVIINCKFFRWIKFLDILRGKEDSLHSASTYWIIMVGVLMHCMNLGFTEYIASDTSSLHQNKKKRNGFVCRFYAYSASVRCCSYLYIENVMVCYVVSSTFCFVCWHVRNQRISRKRFLTQSLFEKSKIAVRWFKSP